MRGSQRGHERIVRVQDQHRIGSQAGHGAAPELGDVVDFPVPVELVAEDVGEHDDPWTQRRNRQGQRGLVDLEQPQLGARSAQQVAILDEGAEQATQQVRARAIVYVANVRTR
jgi:hypothetical protein